jgi:hypothetical protein
LIVTRNTGGAHCCESTVIYSVRPAARELLSVSTGNCPGVLVDPDKDGVSEFQTCDSFANVFCAFAFSPMPAVVFAYDKMTGGHALATPRYLDAAAQVDRSVAAVARRPHYSAV